MSQLPAAPAYGLIRRGCSPANLVNARHAMAARWAWPAAEGGRLAQQTRLAGQAIKPGQGASSPAAPLQPLPGASPPAGTYKKVQCPAELEGAKTSTIGRSSRSRREDFAGDRCAVCLSLTLSSADPLPNGDALRGPKLEIIFHPPTLRTTCVDAS